MITWQEITDTNTPYLSQALALYKASFPPEVLEPVEVLVRGVAMSKNISPNVYHFLIGLDADEQVVALSTAHYLADVNVGFVVYLVVAKAIRGGGLGGQLLLQTQALLEQDAHARGKQLRAILLETEREEDMHTDQEKVDSVRRTHFFARQGFKHLQGVFYLQPPLTPDSMETVPLHLFMKKCSTEESLTSDELPHIVWAMYQEKYGRMNGIDQAVLQECHRQLAIPNDTPLP